MNNVTSNQHLQIMQNITISLLRGPFRKSTNSNKQTCKLITNVIYLILLCLFCGDEGDHWPTPKTPRHQGFGNKYLHAGLKMSPNCLKMKSKIALHLNQPRRLYDRHIFKHYKICAILTAYLLLEFFLFVYFYFFLVDRYINIYIFHYKFQTACIHIC